MFSKAAPVVEPAPDVEEPSEELIPLSYLALDVPAPVAGWVSFLADRDIEVTLDDIGRMAISRDAARMLLVEKREAEAHAREVAARRERQAIEADQLRRSQTWAGVPAAALPEGMSASSVMLQAAKDARPRRESPLQHALANSGELVFHSLAGRDADGE